MEYHRYQPPCSHFFASGDPHSKCVKCMGFFHARERLFSAFQNAYFAKASISKPSALGLRFLKRSNLFFPTALWRPLRPSVNPRPGAQIWNSRRWRASRRASSFLSLSHLSTCARSLWLNSLMNIYILAGRHTPPFLRAR